MKRDMSFILCLLECIEENDKVFCPIRINDSTFTAPSEKVKYHMRLIKDAGFIRDKGIDQGYVVVQELTWAGHEYLSQLRQS